MVFWLGRESPGLIFIKSLTGKANPSYSMLLKLLQEGMTIEEMFGHEIWEQVKKQAALEQNSLNLSDEECRKIVEHGLSMLRRK